MKKLERMFLVHGFKDFKLLIRIQIKPGGGIQCNEASLTPTKSGQQNFGCKSLHILTNNLALEDTSLTNAIVLHVCSLS